MSIIFCHWGETILREKKKNTGEWSGVSLCQRTERIYQRKFRGFLLPFRGMLSRSPSGGRLFPGWFRSTEKEGGCGGRIPDHPDFLWQQLLLPAGKRSEKNRHWCPILAGIMPVTNAKSLLRTAKLCGCSIPFQLSTWSRHIIIILRLWKRSGLTMLPTRS